MNRRKLVSAAWWVLVIGTIVGIALTLLLRQYYVETDAMFLAFLCYAPVGAVIARRKPEIPIGWIFLLVGFLSSLSGVATAANQVAIQTGPPAPWWAAVSGGYQGWYWFVLPMLSTTFTFLLYPSGLPSARWRPVLLVAVVVTLATFVVCVVLSQEFQVGDPVSDPGAFHVDNPISPLPDTAEWLGGLYGAALALYLILAVASGVSALLRFRRSRGVERLQMRLFVSAILLFLAVGLPANAWLGTHGYGLLGQIVQGASIACIPLACGVAVMRYRLYDIDRIIGRTTAYALVTGVLLAVYAVVVTSATAVLPGSGDAAVAGATLAAAAAFRPVLRWARRLVDRRFNREGYDTERTLEQFSARMRAEVDTDDVCANLLAVLNSTVQPAAAGVWLREPSK